MVFEYMQFKKNGHCLFSFLIESVKYSTETPHFFSDDVATLTLILTHSQKRQLIK